MPAAAGDQEPGAVSLRTELRRAEEALGAREERFSALFSSIDEGCCICELVVDDGGTPVDYRFLEVNGWFESMTGLRDAVGRCAYELVPDLEPHWLERYAQVARGRLAARFQDGSEVMGRWFDVFAMPVEPALHFLILFKDITAVRRADEALREREQEERRRRRRAELLATVITELEAIDGVRARGARLVELLVPAIADRVSLELSGLTEPVVAPPGSEPGHASSSEDASTTVTVAFELGDGAGGRIEATISDSERAGFDPGDAALIHELAGHAALLLASAWASEQEHRVAARLQAALLPGELVRHPGIQVAARYQAAGTGQVGGDWYESFLLPDGRLGFAVGDVVGHGLEAAAVMGRMRAGLAALAAHAGTPAELLDDLDRFVSGPGGPALATACCAFLDPVSGGLSRASAGHPAVLVVSPSGAVTWLDQAGSWPLCVGVDEARPVASHRLEEGSLVVLYSDGLVERRSEALTVGASRLAVAAAALRDAPVDEVCDRLLVEMGEGTTYEDDVVVLALRYRGAVAVDEQA